MVKYTPETKLVNYCIGCNLNFRMNFLVTIPNHYELFEATIQALKTLGGSGTTQEINEKVCEREGYTDEQQSILHKQGPQTEISYRLSWARSYLKKYGAIESAGRGFWSLTEKGRNLQVIDKREIIRASQNKKEKDLKDLIEIDESLEESDESIVDTPIPVESSLWTEKLLLILQKMPPDAFERLCQRILR
ncbi:MAG: winged helix-turn-helix domain-containing protein, partial [Phormidium sp.]